MAQSSLDSENHLGTAAGRPMATRLMAMEVRKAREPRDRNMAGKVCCLLTREGVCGKEERGDSQLKKRKEKLIFMFAKEDRRELACWGKSRETRHSKPVKPGLGAFSRHCSPKSVGHRE